MPGIAVAEEPRPFTTFSAGKANVVVSRQGKDYLRFGVVAWGPNWAWTGLDGTAGSRQGATVARLGAKMGGTGVPFHVEFQAANLQLARLELDYRIEAEADIRGRRSVAAHGPCRPLLRVRRCLAGQVADGELDAGEQVT